MARLRPEPTGHVVLFLGARASRPQRAEGPRLFMRARCPRSQEVVADASDTIAAVRQSTGAHAANLTYAVADRCRVPETSERSVEPSEQRSGAMSDSPAQDRIELEVKDFGPIVEARIDLRPLTVFVGPSNTGKSWLAVLIYALHRCFGSEVGPDHWRASGSSLMLPDDEARERLDDARRDFRQICGIDASVLGELTGPGRHRSVRSNPGRDSVPVRCAWPSFRS